jgi:hypothetical protein
MDAAGSCRVVVDFMSDFGRGGAMGLWLYLLVLGISLGN